MHTLSRAGAISHHFSSVASFLLAIVYGYTARGRQDPIVRDTEETIGYFCTTIEPGAYLVDAFPSCKFMYLDYNGLFLF